MRTDAQLSVIAPPPIAARWMGHPFDVAAYGTGPISLQGLLVDDATLPLVQYVVELRNRIMGATACMSPTIFREGGYRFFFFSREEPRMHVHAICGDRRG